MNWRIQKLEQKKAEVVADSEEILDKLQAENREATAAENAQLKVNMARLEEISKKLKVEIDRATFAQSPDCKIIQTGGEGGWPGDPRAAGGDAFASGKPEIKPGDLCFRNAESGALIRALKASEPFCTAPASDGEPFMVGRALHGWLTGRPSLSAGLQQGNSDIGGGYLFEPQMSSMIVDLARSASVCLRAGATTVPMGGSELHLVRVDSDPTAYWRPEGSAVTASTATFGRITLRAKTLAAIVPVTAELLEDAANAASLIEQTIGAQLALRLDQAALAGVGAASEPLGVRNTAGVNTVAAAGAPSGYEKVSEAIGRILAANRPDIDGLAWLIHPRDGFSYDQLLGLLDGQPLQPTPWVAALQRLYTTSISTAEGTGADSYSVVGDFSQMLIGMRTSGVVFRRIPAGTVTDSTGETHNAASELKELLVCHLRADVAIMRPNWFTILTGLLASA